MGIIFGFILGGTIYSLCRCWNKIWKLQVRINNNRWESMRNISVVYEQAERLNKKVNLHQQRAKFKHKTRRYMRQG